MIRIPSLKRIQILLLQLVIKWLNLVSFFIARVKIEPKLQNITHFRIVVLTVGIKKSNFRGMTNTPYIPDNDFNP